jgi:ubiquinone biosynthesis protein
MIRLLRPLLAPAARRALRDRFGPEEIGCILDDAFRDYERQRPLLPREMQTGPRWMVRCAALTAGLYRALVKRRLTEIEARKRTAAVTWLVYEQMARIPWMLARLIERKPYERLKKATDLFRRFPFRAPAYDMVDVPAEGGVVAFDVSRCPVAEHLRAQGLPVLCVDAWCNLDFPLANKWGARLERTGTLAQGAECCDFRWRVQAEPFPSYRNRNT